MRTSDVIAILAAFSCSAEPYFVTLLPGKSFDLPFGSAAEAVCAYNHFSTEFPTGETLVVGGAPFVQPYVCSGPARITCVNAGGLPQGTNGFVTFKIMPGPTDPLKTLVVPPSTNTVRVLLQSSINLVDWTHASTVVLTNPPSATFFRTVIEPEKR